MSTRDINRGMLSSLWIRRISNHHNPDRDAGKERVYQIRVKGHLGPQWMDWFNGLTITLEENGDTLLIGPVIDQAALHGILKKVRDLGMLLLSVNSVEPSRQDVPDVKP